jgi:hypothetical protein
VQVGLFDKADDARRVTLMRTVDQLNLRFGLDTVSFAAAGRRRPWKLRREFLSPRYTTTWDELLRVYESACRRGRMCSKIFVAARVFKHDGLKVEKSQKPSRLCDYSARGSVGAPSLPGSRA